MGTQEEEMLQRTETAWSVNRIIALVLGVVFTLIGILGFFTSTENSTGVRAVLGIFDVDTLHSILNLIIGLLGIAAAFTGQSRLYNQVFGIILLLFGLLGLIPALYFPSGSFGKDSGLFLGLMHDNAGDHILHLIAGAMGLYAGYIYERTGRGTRRAMPL